MGDDLPTLTPQHTAPTPFKLNVPECRVMLQEPGTPASVLHTIVAKAYGFEALYGSATQEPMDPVELWAAIRSDFGADIHESNENRLNAIILAAASDAFYTDPEAFHAIVTGIVHGDVSDSISGEFNDLSFPEIVIATWEVETVRGEDQEFEPVVAEKIQKEIEDEVADIDEQPTGNKDVIKAWRALVQEDLRKIGIPEEIIAQLS